jgi:hypothetical protein
VDAARSSRPRGAFAGGTVSTQHALKQLREQCCMGKPRIRRVIRSQTRQSERCTADRRCNSASSSISHSSLVKAEQPSRTMGPCSPVPARRYCCTLRTCSVLISLNLMGVPSAQIQTGVCMDEFWHQNVCSFREQGHLVHVDRHLRRPWNAR